MMKLTTISVVAILLFAGPSWGQAQSQAPPAPSLQAVYHSGPIPVTPDDPAWKEAPEFQVTLMRQMISPPHGGGSVPSLSVRAIHNGASLAFRLEWADSTANREVGVNRFRDAVAVGFPTRETEVLPAPFMGDEQHTLNIWQWTADFDANAQGAGGFANEYPHTEGVWYFAHDYDVQRQVRAWRGTEPVIEYVARGFGTLERKDAQNVKGLGRHEAGRWQVVLRRELATGNPEDTLFRPGSSTHAVFAVWNGQGEEVNGKKSVTMTWTPVTLHADIAASR